MYWRSSTLSAENPPVPGAVQSLVDVYESVSGVFVAVQFATMPAPVDDASYVPQETLPNSKTHYCDEQVGAKIKTAPQLVPLDHQLSLPIQVVSIEPNETQPCSNTIKRGSTV